MGDSGDASTTQTTGSDRDDLGHPGDGRGPMGGLEAPPVGQGGTPDFDGDGQPDSDSDSGTGTGTDATTQNS